MPVAVATFAGLIAVFLFMQQLKKQEQAAEEKVRQEQERRTQVIFANQNIREGTKIEEGMLEAGVILKDELQPYAAASMDKVVGKIAKVAIAEGEQIQLSKIASVSAAPPTLTQMIPQGKKAVAIKVDETTLIGGLVKPGDTVDIIGVMPVPRVVNGKYEGLSAEKTEVTLYRNIQILTVGKSMSPGAAEERKAASFVTVALSPEEANIVSFVQDNAKIKLRLGSGKESENQKGINTTDWNTVFKATMPQAYVKDPQDTAAKNKVEIYRGRQKEIKYIDLQ